MWRQFSLRSRILMLLAALVALTVGGGMITIAHVYVMDRIFASVLDSDLEGLQAAQELEMSVVMQKGYVSYFFQDIDPQWIDKLDKHHREFENWLKRARHWAARDQERQILNELESQYIRYIHSRDEVIKLYKQGSREEGFRLQQEIRSQFFNIIDLCEKFKETYQRSIFEAREKLKERAALMSAGAVVAIFFAILLGAVLAYVLLSHVLGPIRELATESGSRRGDPGAVDEVAALSRRFQNLIEDVDQTRTKLKWSREHLQQAEKWALVGKLAAGVAHSVRNPLTSVKMRLFSMERSLMMTASQKEDFEVISEEIRHIDTIVNNFLEFSRPPKLKMQKVSPSDAVDMAVQLLRHRLESYDVKVEIQREKRLPEITADPDQLKEVLVNLMVNACEAMVNGGLIVINETEDFAENLGPTVVLKVQDSGPGVPENIQEKLFQPFFSTKGEGTGLGLSIATRIVEEHGGWIDLKSREGEGSTFIITLPAKGSKEWE